MLGLGWGEMFVIAAVALIVIGPKDLPIVLRNAGRAFGALQRMSNEFRRELNKIAAADEIREIKRSISDPLAKTQSEITREFNQIKNGKVEPSGKLTPKEGEQDVYGAIAEKAGLARVDGDRKAEGQAIGVAAAQAETTRPATERVTQTTDSGLEYTVTRPVKAEAVPDAADTAPAPAKRKPAARSSGAKSTSGKTTARKPAAAKATPAKAASGTKKSAPAKAASAPKRAARKSVAVSPDDSIATNASSGAVQAPSSPNQTSDQQQTVKPAARRKAVPVKQTAETGEVQ